MIYFELFYTFFLIGLFTFGGGYAMIPIIQKEVVEKRKWATSGEILDILAISESTPGPISVNAATYVGFKVAGFWGSFFATLGLVIPSFIIIYIISLFYKTFMSWSIVQAAFKGISVGVIILLFMAVLKLRKAVPNSLLSIVIFAAVLAGTLALNIFQIKIPFITLAIIALGLLIGVISTLLTRKEKE